ncbi:MAG: superoxide dismutase family protein [Alphaproteobacteria bacterium]|nr:superoxide dismutase family protein [Alphaproteobacteria bacterium]
MHKTPNAFHVVGGLLAAAALAGFVSSASAATAMLKDPKGNAVGTVELTQLPHGVLLHAQLMNLPEGTHAFHVHGVGKCEPPFKSAGGHYNPTGAKHGLASDMGAHAGDMPNIHVPASGKLDVEVFNSQLALDDKLFDADGAAIVIHQGADDYTSDPAGAAGPRIACGVITK